jgi:phenylacetate-CoA ligase
MSASRAEGTRARWLEVLEKHTANRQAPGADAYWSPALDRASRDELRHIQNEKLKALAPFLYENSAFYRRRFDRLGLLPTDIRDVDDLTTRWPVVTKVEMAEDAAANPPYGTYSTMTEEVWAARGWMLFSTSGSTGLPRVFRYSHVDRDLWAWANARALLSAGIGKGDTVFMVTGYGPHVLAWGAQSALERMELPVIPGGGMDAKARANVILRFKPTVLLCTPSYALHLGRVMQELGTDPRSTSIKTIMIGGEPAMAIESTVNRIQNLWGASLVEFYGCTEASPHAGGYSCPASQSAPGRVTTHLMEDIQIWETVDSADFRPVPAGTRGLTVCTNLNSESSPQLRFLAGDYTILDHAPCPCGRTHVRAVGSFAGRSDDLINLRGIKMFPAQIEQAVRSIDGIGDEYEIWLKTDSSGLDVMTVRVEHADYEHAALVRRLVESEIRSRCEARVGVEVVQPGTLPKTEFKAARIKDHRQKN